MKRLITAVVLGIALLAGIMLVRIVDADPGPGPVHGPPSSGLGQPLKVGDVFSAGSSDLENEGQHPARVERVRLLGVTGSMDLLGVRTRHEPDPSGTFLGLFDFPPPGYKTAPLVQDPVVPVPTERTGGGSPLQRLQLLIGLKPTAPGVARYRAIEVTYSVRGRRHRRVMENSVYLCATSAPEINPADPCPTKEIEGHFEDRVVDVTDILKG
jgi:hypothetical protein